MVALRYGASLAVASVLWAEGAAAAADPAPQASESDTTPAAAAAEAGDAATATAAFRWLQQQPSEGPPTVPPPVEAGNCTIVGADWYAVDSTDLQCCCHDIADQIQHWTDLRGYSCRDYSRSGNSYCNSDGSFADGWWTTPYVGWGDFEDWAVNGVSALDACCACGGGRRAEVVTRRGSPGVAAVPAIEAVTAILNGHVREASDAIPGTDAIPGVHDTCSYSLAPLETDCVNGDPLWVDSEGHNCTSYANGAWCTTQGEKGRGWQTAWDVRTANGGIEAWADDNDVSALDNCCACGSGTKAARDAAAAQALVDSGAQPQGLAIFSAILSAACLLWAGR